MKYFFSYRLPFRTDTMFDYWMVTIADEALGKAFSLYKTSDFHLEETSEEMYNKSLIGGNKKMSVNRFLHTDTGKYYIAQQVVVVGEQDTCTGCAFFPKCDACYRLPQCGGSERTDGRDIIWILDPSTPTVIADDDVYMLASNLKTAISLAQSELSERGQEETIFAEGLRTIYKALLDGKTIKIKN